MVLAPTESNIDLSPNVPVCVFIPDELEDVWLPDLSTIDNNMLNVPLDDPLDDSVWCNMHKLFPFSSDSSASMTNSTITCDTTDTGSVGNTSIALYEVYEVFNDDIEYCSHWLKIIHKNETPATICTVNTIGTICSRQLFRILLTQELPAVSSKSQAYPQESFSKTSLMAKILKPVRPRDGSKSSHSARHVPPRVW
jgi:hypothetical protein